MTLRVSKSSPIQYQIADFVQKSLPEKNPLATATLEQMCYAVFENFRVSKGKPLGLRLTTFGNSYMRKRFESFSFELAEPVVGTILVQMDSAMLRPYYLTKKKIEFYDENDAAWFKLGGNDLKYFAGNL